MFRSSSRREGSRFTLLLGCCSGGPSEDNEWPKKQKKVKRKCTELLSSASHAVCSCLDESGGSSASSYAYLPAAEYAAAYGHLEVPYINRYPNLVIPPEERFTVHHYYLRPPKKSPMVAAEQKCVEDAVQEFHDEKDLNENPTLQKEEEEESPGESDRNEDEPTNNNERRLRRSFSPSVESVRAKVLKEHVGWRNATALRRDLEEAEEEVDVEMPGVLREIEDDDEGYDEWKESRNAALERLAGKCGKK